jgi:acetyl esterase
MNWKLKLLLAFIKLRDAKNKGNITVELLRNEMKQGSKLGNFLFSDFIQIKKVTDKNIQGRHGTIPVRIYDNLGTPNQTTIVFFHGGGFVVGDLESHDYVCRHLCKQNQAVVIAVDYRLAPEFKFPFALEDAYDATKWVQNNITEINGNKEKIIVMGDSAGGNLAAGVSIQARDLGELKIAGQILIYPWVDATFNHPSYKENGEGYLLTQKNLDFFDLQYVPNGVEKKDPTLSPIFTKDFKNLPIAFIATAQYDPLRDEGYEYAKLLKKEGVQTQYIEYKNMVHGFFNIPKIGEEAMQCYKDVNQFIATNF